MNIDLETIDIGIIIKNVEKGVYSGDTRSPIPVISVHSVGNLQTVNVS